MPLKAGCLLLQLFGVLQQAIAVGCLGHAVGQPPGASREVPPGLGLLFKRKDRGHARVHKRTKVGFGCIACTVN